MLINNNNDDDVDRELANGNLELGVHIADVTHFVKPDSLTDMEAKSRSTTVYLADRRYDMLPGILSANLCSLISGQVWIGSVKSEIFVYTVFEQSLHVHIYIR